MKRFILKSLLAVALVLVALILFAVVRLSICCWSKQSFFKLQTYQKILAIGDSNTYCSIVENEKCGIKVFAFANSPVNVSLMRLKEMERRGVLNQIKVLLLNFSYPTLKLGSRDIGNQEYSVWQFFPYSLLYINDWKGSFGKNTMFIMERVLSLQCPEVYKDISKEMASSELDSEHIWTADDKQKAYDDWFNISLAAQDIASEAEFINSRKSSLILNILQMQQICRKHNIRFVLFAPPIPDIAESIATETSREMLQEVVKTVQSQGVLFVDFRKLFSEGLNSNKFRDLMHLSFAGAKEFTEILYQNVLKRLIEDYEVE